MKAGRLTAVLAPPLLILARLLVMILLAGSLTVLFEMAAQRLLPPATSFDRTFDRLAYAALAGLLLGSAMGGAITHRLGRARYGFAARLLFGAIAAVPLVVLALVIVLDLGR